MEANPLGLLLRGTHARRQGNQLATGTPRGMMPARGSEGGPWRMAFGRPAVVRGGAVKPAAGVDSARGGPFWTIAGPNPMLRANRSERPEERDVEFRALERQRAG